RHGRRGVLFLAAAAGCVLAGGARRGGPRAAGRGGREPGADVGPPVRGPRRRGRLERARPGRASARWWRDAGQQTARPEIARRFLKGGRGGCPREGVRRGGGVAGTVVCWGGGVVACWWGVCVV